MKEVSMARFDARMPREQKELFEYAATLGGYRSLTDFIVHSVKIEADKIIREHNTILASQKDKEIFFDALMNPQDPNEKLKEAAREYDKMIGGQ